MFKKRRKQGDQTDRPAAKARKPRFDVESLEKRVLMSASWVDADTGDARDGPTSGNDHLIGTDGGDVADGGQGHDLLDGHGGNDILSGGEGDDALSGGDGNDILAGNTGNDTLDGGGGYDTADYSTSAGPIHIDLTVEGIAQNTGGDGLDTLTSIEGVIGSSYDDTFAFAQPVSGATYSIDGGGGSNAIDLSDFSSENVSFGDGSLTVTNLDGGTFVVEYESISSINFQDVDAVVADGGLVGYAVSADTLLVDNDIAIRIDLDGGTATIDYDAATNTAGIELAGSGGTLALGAQGDANIDLDVADTSAAITSDVSLGTVSYAGDVFGSLTVDGDIEAISIGDDLDGGVLTVSGSVGSITLGDDIKNGGEIHVQGNVGSIVATDVIRGDCVIAIQGDLDRIEAGTGIGSGVQITAGGVTGEVSIVDGGTTHAETVDGIGTMTYDGDTLTIEQIVPSPDTVGLSDSAAAVDAILAREPVAYWQFTEGGAEEQIAGVNGDYVGDASFGDSSHRSVSFDGTGDVVTIPHSEAFELDSASVEFKFNPDNATPRQGLFSKDSTNFDNGGHLTVWVDDGRVEVRLQSDSQSYTLTSDQVVQSGEWTDVTVQFGEGGFKLFVNGQLADSDAYTGGMGTSSGGTGNEEPIVLGANAWQSGDQSADNLKEHFSGLIADVAIYELEPPAPPTAVELGLPGTAETMDSIDARDPVAHWSFGDAGVTDLVGSADGDYFGNADVLDADGRAAFFDGSGDYVVLNHAESLELENGSIEFRFNADDANDRQGLFSKDSSGYDDGGHVTMWVDGGRVVARVQSADASYDLQSDAIVQSGEWTDVALRFGDDGLQLFVNGELQDSDAYTGGLGSNSGGTGNTEPIVLGANQWASGDGVANNLREFFAGQIADVAIYDTSVLANTAPINLVVDSSSVPENAAVGTLVGTASASDADAGDTLTYSLADDADGRFAIDPSTGEISVAGDLDHEGSVAHEVTVVATDAEGLSVEQAVMITVGDVNESPAGLGFVGGSVSENAPAGTVVGSASAADPDAGDILTYSLADDAGGRFVIDAATGEVSVSGDAHLNFEAEASHSITVRVTDESGESIEQAVEIGVANVHEVTVLSGNDTLHASDGPFEDVVINGGYVEIDGDVEIKGDLTIERVSRINGGELRVTGDVTVLDTGYHGSATVVVSGDGAQEISTGGGVGELHRVSIENGSGEVTVAGDLQISGSYADNGNAVDASGAHFEIQGNASVSASSTSFGDVTIDAGYIEVEGEMEIAGDLTIERVSRINGGELRVTGDVTVLDTGYHGSATVVVSGDGAQEISTGGGVGELHRVSIENGSGEVTVAGDLQISGSYADNGNAVDASGAHFEIQGNASVSASSTSFGDVTIDAGYIEVEGEMEIAGDLTIERVSRINGGELRVTGDVTVLDAGYHGSATVVVSGDGAQEISTGGGVGELHRVSIENGSGEVTVAGDLQISGSYADNGNAVDASGAHFEIQGNASVSASSTSFGDVTIDAGYIEVEGEMEIAGDLTIERVSRINGGELRVTGDVTVLDAGYHGSATVVVSGDGAQEISTGGGVGELHRVSIENGSGEVTVAGDLQISGSYADNGNAVDASGAHFEIQGNASVSASSTSFGDVTIDAGYIEVEGEMEIAGDLTIERVSRINGGELRVTGDVTVLDAGYHGSATVVVSGDGAQEISTGGGVGELHRVSIENGSGEVTVAGDLQISGSYADNGNAVDASGAHFEIQGNASVSASSTSFGDVTIDAGYIEVEGEMYVSGDALVQRLARINGGTIYVAGEISLEDASWSGTGSIEQWVTNEAPEAIQFVGGSVSENAPAGTVVASASATDPDAGDSLTYSLSDDAGGRFAIDASTGEIVTTGELDFEGSSSHTVTVRAVDGDGLSIERDLTVTVGDVNESPAGLGFVGGSVSENAPAGTVVASASATDPDAGDSLTYSLSDDAGGRFAIDASTGEIVTTGELDFEGSSGHTVTVRAVDGDGLSIERDLTVTVGDVNESPAGLGVVGGSVSENAPAGTVVASASATDPDAGDSLTYSLSDDAGGRFAIDASTGEIVTTGELDFEGSSSHTVTVRAVDGDGLSIERDLTVTVGDVNESPAGLGFVGGSVSENAPAGTVVASASATDPDAGDSLTYSLSDDAGGRFAIDASTGEIVTTGELDFEGSSSHTVTVRAVDGDGLSIERDLTVTVGDVNESPVFGDDAPIEVQAVQGELVSVAAGAMDPDGDSLSYEWRQVSGPAAEISDPASQSLEFTAGNFESDTQLVFVVRVTDGEHAEERAVRVVVAAGDAGRDLATSATASQAGVDALAGTSEMRDSPELYQSDDEGRDAPGVDVAAEPSVAGGDGEQSLEWMVSEIDEIAEIARSIEPADLGDPSSGREGEPAVAFEHVFSDLDSSASEVRDGESGDEPRGAQSSEGFVMKLLTLLRAGFGAHGRDEEDAGSVQDRFKR